MTFERGGGCTDNSRWMIGWRRPRWLVSDAIGVAQAPLKTRNELVNELSRLAVESEHTIKSALGNEVEIAIGAECHINGGSVIGEIEEPIDEGSTCRAVEAADATCSVAVH